MEHLGIIQNALEDYEPFWKAVHQKPPLTSTQNLPMVQEPFSADKQNQVNNKNFFFSKLNNVREPGPNRSGLKMKESTASKAHSRRSAAPRDLLKMRPDGLYAWGGPGSGKSFLLDLAYDTLETDFKLKMHFDDFMTRVHESVYQLAKVFTASNYFVN